MNFLELVEKNKLHHDGKECTEVHKMDHMACIMRQVRNRVDNTGNYAYQSHRIDYNALLKEAKLIFYQQQKIHVLDYLHAQKDNQCNECRIYSRREKDIKDLEKLIYTQKPHTKYIKRMYK